MPRITDISAQKNGQFYSIFVDGRYSFSLSDLDLSASDLRVGKELQDSQLETWIASSGQSKLRNQALKYLAIRPRAELEVRQYLARKGADGSVVDQVLIWLESYGYVNDADFAQRWVDYRRRLSSRSDARIRLELRQKGIDGNLIDAALGAGDFDQEQALRDLIAKRRHRYADEQKFIQYLARQGYGWGQIQKALKDD